MSSTYRLPSDLSNFIEVYGNRQKHYHYLAIRFKRAIIIYKPNRFDTIPIAPPKNSIIVIRGKCPPFTVQAPETFLLYTDDPSVPGIHVTSNSAEALLRALVSRDRIIFSFFKSDVLYLITTENRFTCFMKKLRREKAFHALCAFKEAHFNKRALTLAEVSQLRFFSTSKEMIDLKHFNKWHHFAYELSHDPCFLRTRSQPSQKLGKLIFSILQRSYMPPGPLPSLDFYFCEIHMTDDTTPLGIVCALSQNRERDLEYVSPMVVQQPKTEFLDSGHVMCNTWLPLYRNRDAWLEFGLIFYLMGLDYKKELLKRILCWLQIQTSEKYLWMYMDLRHVAKILCGEQSEAFLSPIVQTPVVQTPIVQTPVVQTATPVVQITPIEMAAPSTQTAPPPAPN